MHKLSFRFRASQSSNDHEVRVLIDDNDVLEDFDRTMLGVDPVEFFAQRALRESGNLVIGRCGCGIAECDSAGARVARQAQTVEWRLFEKVTLLFDSAVYDKVISDAASDFSWETKERTAERLVANLDYGRFTKLGLQFQWASARISPRKITVSFRKGDKQQLYDANWDHKNPADAVTAIQKVLNTIK